MAKHVAENLDNPYLAAGLELTAGELVDFAEWHHGWDSDCPDRPEPPLWMYDHHPDGNVIRLTRPALTRTGQATVIGNLEAPDCDALLNSPAVVGVTDRAPRVFGDKWVRFEGTWGDVVKMMTTHPERADKGGHAIFFAESDRTGKTVSIDGQTFRYMYKLKNKLRTVYAVAIDVDGGCSAEPVITRLRELGIFAVVYTTHSHTTKGGPGSDRFRVIIPLAEPFEFGEDWNARYAEWQSRYIGLCEHLIPGEIDARGRLPSQLMYMPARPKGAEFKHYVIAGRGLALDDMPVGDVSKYTRRAPSGAQVGNEGAKGEPAFLSDGFDLLAWWREHGSDFLLRDFLEMLGWDVLGDAGEGFEIACPNAGAHSEGTGETAWAIDGLNADSGATVYCHHDHCDGIYTCDFLRLIGEQIDLPDGCQSLSALLCDPIFYPDDSAPSIYDYGILRPVSKLRTAKAVEVAYDAIGELDDDAIASLYAGVIWAKNKEGAREKLEELIGGTKKERERHSKAGEAYLEDWKAKQNNKRVSEVAENFVLSLDPSDPLGHTPEQKLESLSARFAVCNYKGKTLVFRTVDRDALEAGDDLLEFWTKDSLKQFYAHESWPEGEGKAFKWVNPVDRWWGEAKRHTRVVFYPSEPDRSNEINLFDSSRFSLESAEGDAGPIRWFLKYIICDGNEETYKWLFLYLAHMVQRPWERPGTALVMYGDGRTGKGTFGEIIRRLTHPYNTTLIDPNHVVGTFAGPALATSLAVISEEAVFGKSAEVADRLKGMITLEKQRVEAKGVQSIVVTVYYRMIFDSNHDVPVRIEGNNSEMRFLVLKVSKAKMGDKEYFKELYDHIAGEAMQAFLKELEEYDPASAGFEWDDVRLAPETVHRKQMWADGLRDSDKQFLAMLEDGVFEWKEGVETFRIFLSDDGENRIPARAVDHWVRSFAGRHESDMRPASAVWKRLFREELDKPKAARASGERRVLDEGGGGAEYMWQPFPFNTPMYHLPGLSVIRGMVEARLGVSSWGRPPNLIEPVAACCKSG